MPPTLLIVDDDLLSREVLTLFAADAGYTVESFAGGLDAVDRLLQPPVPAPPLAILCDLQMPAPCGETLAHMLRAAAAPGTRLLAMSAAARDPEAWAGYDAFLQKPFTLPALEALLESPAPHVSQTDTAVAPPALDPAIFASFAQALPPRQLDELYTLCLDDVVRRIAGLEAARLQSDERALRDGAHALKGGCGMVGAHKLAALAAAFETGPMPGVDQADACQEIRDAAAELRRILLARSAGLSPG